MIKTNSFEKAISFLMAAAMLFSVAAVTTPIEAQAAVALGGAGDVSDGVDFTAGDDGLLNPKNHIYYGAYNHATEWIDENSSNVPPWSDKYRSGAGAHEGQETPVLWRIVGEDEDETGTDDGKITLLSEYVLDSAAFFPNSIDPSELDPDTWDLGFISLWKNSDIRAWLNNGAFTGKSESGTQIEGSKPTDYSSSGFLNSFSAAELFLIPETHVYTSMYETYSSIPYRNSTDFHVEYVADSTRLTQDRIFLPWGIWEDPFHQFPEEVNKVWYGAADRINDSIPSGEISDNELKKAYLKNDAEKTTPINWWLRSPGCYHLLDYEQYYIPYHEYTVLHVGKDGTVGVGYGFLLGYINLGVRPMFKLNPESVIFASEIKAGANTAKGETKADNNYSAAADGSKNFKLTVLGGNNGADVGSLSGVPASVTVYKTEDNAFHNAVTGLIAEPSYANEGSNATGYTVNYKIVDGSGGTRKIIGYGFSDYNEDLVIDSSALTPGNTYDAYVWLQRNNEINSHEGTRPQRFQLSVQELQTAPYITASPVLVNTDILVDTGESDDTYANAVRKILFGEDGHEIELSEGTGFEVDGNDIKILAEHNQTEHSSLNIKLLARGYNAAATTVQVVSDDEPYMSVISPTQNAAYNTPQTVTLKLNTPADTDITDSYYKVTQSAAEAAFGTPGTTGQSATGSVGTPGTTEDTQNGGGDTSWKSFAALPDYDAVTGTASLTVSLEGKNYVHWYVINDFGVEKQDVTGYFEIDTVAPNISQATATARSTSSIALSVTADDGGSGIASYQWRFAASPDGPFHDVPGGGVAACEHTGLNPGTAYYYRVQVTDNAGNTAESETINSATQTPPRSGGSSSGGPTTPATSSAPVVSPVDNKGSGALNTAIDKAVNTDGNSLSVKLKNVSDFTKANADAIIKKAKELGIPAKVSGDVMSEDGTSIEVRITLDPALITQTVKLDGYIRESQVRATKAMLDKFFVNKTTVVHLGQEGAFGQTARVAAKVDLAGFDGKNLYFYAYDKKANVYRRIENPAYRIDSNGYLHFNTDFGGDIIISENPLVRK